MTPKHFLIHLPEGIPTYAGRHALRTRPPDLGPAHLLHRNWDLIWVVKGRLRLTIGQRGHVYARCGDFLIVPPFYPCVNEGASPGGQQFWLCHFAMRPPAAGTELELATWGDFRGPGMHGVLPLVFSARRAPQVARAYRRLNRERLRRAARPWRLEIALLEMVAALAEFARANAAKGLRGELLTPLAHDQRIARIRRRLEAEPGRKWSVAGLAADENLSPNYLNALCKGTLGISIKELIIDSRLRHALNLLLARPGGEPFSVLEVSRRCGYATQHHFSYQFKSRYGVSPLRYRNRRPASY